MVSRRFPLWSWCGFLLLGSGAIFLFFLGLLFLCAADTFPLPAETKRTACAASLAAAFVNLALLCLLAFLLSKPKGWIRERLSAHTAGRSLLRFFDDFSARLLLRGREGGRRRRGDEEEERDRRDREEERDSERGRHSAFHREASQYTFSRLNRKRDFLRDELDTEVDKRPEVEPGFVRDAQEAAEADAKTQTMLRLFGAAQLQHAELGEAGDAKACTREAWEAERGGGDVRKGSRGAETGERGEKDERSVRVASFLEGAHSSDMEDLDLLACEAPSPAASPTSTAASSEVEPPPKSVAVLSWDFHSSGKDACGRTREDWNSATLCSSLSPVTTTSAATAERDVAVALPSSPLNSLSSSLPCSLSCSSLSVSFAGSAVPGGAASAAIARDGFSLAFDGEAAGSEAAARRSLSKREERRVDCPVVMLA
ncbi:conserved hypothetical protein [Neospora caninum Liverpool]|uniref:Transmembrane protein n=1 Tax=Neospora caninum (strain Liverpool) TaxID=572307 RepID=F0V720_NEOCL|nr:conserved hypothetical protein [Neospora caninum Liverpool]CBZ49511.1 conserved hypothetical protein [Neospora caninum Liverpool]CEL64090.1 TPA: hypothetical protein BN1204_000090 [Neospora caninum Liverpool]|eukprot:XP_003879546.1 conserved hypothetical protein [Neospora caninum Liverpool]